MPTDVEPEARDAADAARLIDHRLRFLGWPGHRQRLLAIGSWTLHLAAFVVFLTALFS